MIILFLNYLNLDISLFLLMADQVWQLNNYINY